MSFLLRCWRAEKKWWGHPNTRLMKGFTISEPFYAKDMSALWAKVKLEILTKAKGNLTGYLNYLKRDYRYFVLASSRDKGQKYNELYNYVIRIKGAHAFPIEKDLSLGAQVDYGPIGNIKKDHLILDANSVAKSTILGLGSSDSGLELTFFSDIPLKYIKTCNKKFLNQYKIFKEWDDLSISDKLAGGYTKYLKNRKNQVATISTSELIKIKLKGFG